ncbi:unnamed protein product [Mytilus coruscus]|uniref:CARD domain-containing protein n=1 Tax=Mytilus coruscus TaxID=42192 RepID=A0A6J8BMJ7_MYTCO|nr:unnamed protein product [Mytilus coruscus]
MCIISFLCECVHGCLQSVRRGGSWIAASFSIKVEGNMKTADILAFLYKPQIVEVWKMAEGGEKHPDVLGERERKMRDSNLPYSLRSNFTSLMRRLENRVREMETYLNQFLTIEEILRVGMIDDPRRKINMVLRYVLHRNEKEHESFMRYLIEKRYITEKDLQEFKHVPDAPEYRQLTAEDFNRPEIRRFVEKELEVTTILDYLYERYLINLEEYEEMERASSRIEQVRILLAILQRRRDDSWTSKFCYILNTFGHHRILRGMQNIKNQHHIGMQESDIPVFGSTFKLDTDHQTQIALREQSAADLNNHWQNDDHRITGTRPGCVEFMLLSGSKKACKILDKDDQEEKCRTFLQSLTSMTDVKKTLKPGQIFKIKVQMFDSSLPIVPAEKAKNMDFNLAIKICKTNLIGDLKVKVIMNLLVEHEMINQFTVAKLSETSEENLIKEYLIYLLGSSEEDKLKQVLAKARESETLQAFVDHIEQWRCVECYRKTLLTFFQNVEDEIDTKIMEKTLIGENDVPDLLTNVCIHKAENISRGDRAKLFLQYILTNENILMRFAAVFATMSKVVLTHTSCVYCSKDKSTSRPTDDTPAYTFVVEDVNGEFVVRSTEKRKNGTKFPERRHKYESFHDSVHYTRFVNGAGIGCITKERRSKLFRKYKEHAENESVQSVDNTINDEISSYDDLDGINIMTHDRHGWRKNAKDTTVVALGEKTHKVMDCEHVTKS